jgi:hypothetical protein
MYTCHLTLVCQCLYWTGNGGVAAQSTSTSHNSSSNGSGGVQSSSSTTNTTSTSSTTTKTSVLTRSGQPTVIDFFELNDFSVFRLIG